MYRLVRLGPQRLPASPRSPSVATIPHVLGCGLRLARAGLTPPLPLVTLRSAAGTSAKDAGGSPEKATTDPSGEDKKLNKSQQLKQVFKEYGAVGVSFHIGISLVSLGIFYLAVSRLRRNPESTEISVTRITSYVNIFQRSPSQRQGICGFLMY
ncbi:protein FAM210B, mitochondrial isoform X2 [Nyctibius grandis]|uniref:protein FAM210B, mitochondrial isoform X2 n=1 Tax=Nyctibius grandis TaxID=48427 RepID=UPI0035BBC9C0